MYTRTLLQLKTSVQQLGAWENSSDITGAVLTQYINDALEDTYNICIACRDDYYTRIASPFITLVAGQDTYAFPTDFYGFRKAEIAMDAALTCWRTLLPVPIDGANLRSAASLERKRYRYRVTNQGLVVVPVPTSADTVRLYYVPLAPQLTADTDSVTFDRPVEQKLVIAMALRDCFQREDLDTSQQDAQIDRYEKQLRTVADTHDDGQPFYLSRRGPEGDEEEGW